MQDAARISALIELVDSLQQQWNNAIQRGSPALPAEQHIQRYCKDRRYIGSKDRRWLNEHFFGLIRGWGEMEQLLSAIQAQDSATMRVYGWLMRQRALSAETLQNYSESASNHTPPRLTQEQWQALESASIIALSKLSQSATANLPEWLYQRIQQQYGADCDAICTGLQQPASPDIRLNRRKGSFTQLCAMLAREAVEIDPITGLEDAATLPQRVPLSGLKSYQQGWFELQDRGSQWIMHGLPLHTGMRVLDYCAGAGGKSLWLASHAPKLQEIIAHDADISRLKRLKPRAVRAGADAVIQLCEPAQCKRHAPFDMVILDAPCSGTGTVRRHPDLPWRLTKAQLNSYVHLQQQLLQEVVPLVKPGGYLYYITCSLLAEENEHQIRHFLEHNTQFSLVRIAEIWNNKDVPVEMRRLLPHLNGSDGFFAALLQRKAI